MKLIGIGKFNRTTVSMKDNIEKDKYDKYVNMLNNDYKNILKVTDEYKLIEQVKGEYSDEDISLNLELIKEGEELN